jgi:hypothetical protein
MRPARMERAFEGLSLEGDDCVELLLGIGADRRDIDLLARIHAIGKLARRIETSEAAKPIFAKIRSVWGEAQ